MGPMPNVTNICFIFLFSSPGDFAMNKNKNKNNNCWQFIGRHEENCEFRKQSKQSSSDFLDWFCSSYFKLPICLFSWVDKTQLSIIIFLKQGDF